MTDREFLKELIARGQSETDGYFHYAHLAACLLEKRLYEQLHQLVGGPVYDGHALSKQDRSELFDLGLAVRICHKGEQGYSGATYFAFSVLKATNEIKAGRSLA